ncbi:transcriptional repressor [Nocardioides sp. Y6]|uniref:Transcriptional repressor n=2 Tax=Nocardioides malaquae TaxID=2773426 RepID=A0ABR9RUP6_9ACTN|nr:transcriptional repressor [Nocardioides malaquae]
MTPQRQLVLTAVEELGHATPEQVRDHLAGAVNTSTVYRNLEVLEELGLVRHTHLTDRAPTYHSARGEEHFHLICRACRREVAVPAAQADDFAAHLRQGYGFVADVAHVAIFGRCEDCGADDPERPDHADRAGRAHEAGHPTQEH